VALQLSIEEVLRRVITEVRVILNARLDLRFVKQAKLLGREKTPHFVQDPELP
jgi:hypothetical protein